MSKPVEGLEAFASLHIFFELAKTNKPTLEQAEVAVLALCRFYGVENEETLLNASNAELVKAFKDIRFEIYNMVN